MCTEPRPASREIADGSVAAGYAGGASKESKTLIEALTTALLSWRLFVQVQAIGCGPPVSGSCLRQYLLHQIRRGMHML